MTYYKHQRYLQKDDGAVYVWTEVLSRRKDMKPFHPAIEDDEQPTAVTREFLETKTKIEISGYAKSVYDVDLTGIKKKSEMIDELLKIQDQAGE